MIKILTPYLKDNFSLKNHLVMAPMTRSRAIDNLPNNLMAEYYGSGPWMPFVQILKEPLFYPVGLHQKQQKMH